MTVGAVLARARAAAEGVMTDSCWIRRAGSPSTDTATGAVTPTWSDIYGTESSGAKCRVQETTSNSDQEDAGESLRALSGLIISIPISDVLVIPGDQVVIATSAYDPALVGRTFNVVRVIAKSHASARRLWCEEVQS